MAGLSTEPHAPFDGARLAAVFEHEDDMRLATRAGRWPFDPTQWQDWMAEPDLRGYFVMDGGADAGHFALRARDGGRHLSWLLLRRDWRGGRGREVLDLAQKEARDLGAGFLTLNVLHTNPRAAHLYRAHGFTPLSEADGKVTMVKDLGRAA